MKKIFCFAATLITLLFAASCQKETFSAGDQGDVVTATITVKAPAGVSTKAAIGDGTTADNLVFGVFTSTGVELPALRQGDWVNGIGSAQELVFSNDPEPKVTVKVQLVRGLKYQFVCWAQNKAATCYDFSDLKNIGISYTDAAGENWVSQDENRDAFYAHYMMPGVVTDNFSIDMSLYRPFAQVNVGTDDLVEAVNAGLDVTDLHSTMTIYNAATSLNTFTGEAAGNEKVTFAMAPAISKSNPGDADGVWLTNLDTDRTDLAPYYGWLAMNYFLVAHTDPTTEDATTTFDFSIYQGGAAGTHLTTRSIPNVPVMRNYQTHLLGSVLTANGTITVVIKPAFLVNDNIVNIWDGESVSEPTVSAQDPDALYISDASQLAWVADQVNNKNNTFEGKTLYIVADINLANNVWTPIGAGETPFMGNIVGAVPVKSTTSVTISGLNVDYTSGPAGLVGWLKGGSLKNINIVSSTVKGAQCVGAVVGKIFNSGLVENCSIDDVDVAGYHWVGGIVGSAYGSVKGCSALNSTVTATENDADVEFDGDKAGGIIGFHPADAKAEVSGNTVKDVVVTAKRDAGAVAGAANASNLKGNTVADTDLVVSGENAGAVLGRPLGGALSEDNVAENVTLNGAALIEKKSFTVDTTPVELAADATETVIAVDGNVAWTVSATEGATLSVASGEGKGTVKVTFPANEDTENAKIYSVTFSTTASVDTKEYVVKITQAAAEAPEVEQVLADGNYYISFSIDGAVKNAKGFASGYGELPIEDAATASPVQGYPENVFTFTFVDGQGYTIQYSGAYLYMKGTYNNFNASTNLPEEGAVWTIAKNDDNTYSIVNTFNQKTMQISTKSNQVGAFADVTGALPILIAADNVAERPQETIKRSIEDGVYWIMNSDKTKVAMPITGSYGDLAVTNSISGASIAEYAFTFTFVDGKGYTIADPNGKYYYQQGTYNNFNVSTSISDACYWNVEETEDGFVITNIKLNKYIQYTTKFGSFASAQSNSTLPVLVKADKPASFLSVNDSYSVDATAESVIITIDANVEWTAEVSADAEITQGASGNGDGTISVSFPVNEDSQEKIHTLTITSLIGTQTVTIVQGPAGIKTVNATLSFADKSNRTAYSTSSQTWQQNEIIVTNEKASSTSNVGDYSNPARFYKSSSLKVEAPGRITQIVFKCNTAAYANDLAASASGLSISGTDVTATLDGTTDTYQIDKLSAQVRMDSIVVSYIE